MKRYKLKYYGEVCRFIFGEYIFVEWRKTLLNIPFSKFKNEL